MRLASHIDEFSLEGMSADTAAGRRRFPLRKSNADDCPQFSLPREFVKGALPLPQILRVSGPVHRPCRCQGPPSPRGCGGSGSTAINSHPQPSTAIHSHGQPRLIGRPVSPMPNAYGHGQLHMAVARRTWPWPWPWPIAHGQWPMADGRSGVGGCAVWQVKPQVGSQRGGDWVGATVRWARAPEVWRAGGLEV